jgi:DNA invertase Pin-like site-specific DNA recombinase
MDHDEILKKLRKSAAERHHNDVLKRALAKQMRELVREAHAAGVGPTQIAREANLSRQAVYEILGQQPS